MVGCPIDSLNAPTLSLSEQALDLCAELRLRQSTLSYAESCTGGLLSSVLTENAGVSDVFQGSVISYANRVKVELLGVSEKTLKAHGAVSETTAREMARGAREKLHSTWAIAITGVAGPSGGSVDKPVGTVCFAVSGPDFEGSKTARFAGNRVAVQRQSVAFAMSFLLETLKI